MSNDKAMIRAAKAGDLAAIQALLATNTDLLLARDSDGSTALHCAAWKGHVEVVAFLLRQGADVQAHNTDDHWATTPLYAAAHANHAGIVQLLIDHGADVRAPDLQGRTPLEHTAFHKATRAAKLLQARGAR